jgi:hypothetical protein
MNLRCSLSGISKTHVSLISRDDSDGLRFRGRIYTRPREFSIVKSKLNCKTTCVIFAGALSAFLDSRDFVAALRLSWWTGAPTVHLPLLTSRPSPPKCCFSPFFSLTLTFARMSKTNLKPTTPPEPALLPDGPMEATSTRGECPPQCELV